MKGTKKVNENMINENAVSQPGGEDASYREGYKASFPDDSLRDTEALDERTPLENSESYSHDGDEAGFYNEEALEEQLESDTEEDPEEDFQSEALADINEDIAELKRQFPELAGLSSADELQNKEKYLRFRGLGLTPMEAYMASGGIRVMERPRPTSPLSVKRRDEGIPDRQLRMARELFSEMSDTEIQALYRRVTK